MRTRAQSAHIVRSRRRVTGLVASVLLLTFWGFIRPALAQEGDGQAGLVIQFGDGSLHTACVDLGPSGQASGEEVLRASGFDTLVDYGSGFGGGTVCKIGDVGCDFPAEKCFCHCTMKPGTPCIYWSYFHLVDGEWRYAIQGASSYTVRSGDVEGWVWGAGSAGTGAAPPLITFEQICDASPQVTRQSPENELRPSTGTPEPHTPVATSRPDATTTRTPAPSPVPPATPTLEPASAALPSATPGAIASNAEDMPTSSNNEAPSEASPVQEAQGVSDNRSSYFVFGLLVLVLVAGLIRFRARLGR